MRLDVLFRHGETASPHGSFDVNWGLETISNVVAKTSTSLGDLELENGDFVWMRSQVRNRMRRQFSLAHIQFFRQSDVSQAQAPVERQALGTSAPTLSFPREKGSIDCETSRLVIFTHEVAVNQGAETAVAGVI
ncbi:unnamed protein product [Mortierella alpina]